MANTTNFNWETPDDTDLVKDGAAAIRTLGNSIDTSMMDLKGGTTGQILSKTSNTDMDFTWINNDQGDITAVTAGTGITVTGGTGPTPAVALTVPVVESSGGTNQTTYTTGDILYASASNTLSKRTVGTSGQVLTVSGGVPTWAAASTGKIAQLVTDSAGAAVTTTTATWTDTGLNITITPTNSASTLLFWFSTFCRKESGDADNYVEMKLALTTGGDIQEYGYNFEEGENSNFAAVIAGTAYAAASSTSSRTYRLYFRSRGGSGSSSTVAADGKGGSIFCLEVLP